MTNVAAKEHNTFKVYLYTKINKNQNKKVLLNTINKTNKIHKNKNKNKIIVVFFNTPIYITNTHNKIKIFTNKTKYQQIKTPSSKQHKASAYRPRHKGHQMALAYRPRHKEFTTLDYKSHYQTKPTKNLKSPTFNTFNKITNPTQQTQLNLKYQLLHKLHPNPLPNPIPYPHTKHNLHPTYKPYENQKMTLTYRPHQYPRLKNHNTTKYKPYVTTKHIPQKHLHTCLPTRHNTHQNHKPHPKNHPYPKPNCNTKHKLYPKNKMALTY